MKIDPKNLISITQANQNFSKVARLVDENGSVVILKNNVPRYIILEFNQLYKEELADEKDVMRIGERIMKQYEKAFRELAK